MYYYKAQYLLDLEHKKSKLCTDRPVHSRRQGATYCSAPRCSSPLTAILTTTTAAKCKNLPIWLSLSEDMGGFVFTLADRKITRILFDK